MKNNAKYLENGKEMNVRGEDLMGTAKPYHTGFLGFNFVAYNYLSAESAIAFVEP